MTPDKPKRGRPPTSRGPYNPHKPMQLGRVSGEDKALLKAAAKKSGKWFTRWALEILLREAERELGE